MNSHQRRKTIRWIQRNRFNTFKIRYSGEQVKITVTGLNYGNLTVQVHLVKQSGSNWLTRRSINTLMQAQRAMGPN